VRDPVRGRFATRLPPLAASAALLAALACSTAPARIDAGATITGSFDQPVGASCNAGESLLCASGGGACDQAVCRAFCSAVEFPRCPAGQTERAVRSGDRDLCLCIPN
jgi:hypothetical protein